MGAKSHFRVAARFDLPANTGQVGTVTIDRGAGLFTVRPYRRRRTFELPLDVVADMVVARVIRAEILTRKATKKTRA